MAGQIAQRVTRFAALQAAQRALAHSSHPSELAPLRTTSRELLIQLQNFSRSSVDVDSGESLGTIDNNLEVLTERILAILRNLQLAQLKATIPQLVLQHPEEVRGLIDVLLSGDLEDDKELRILEYLVTNLSTQEKGGRRVIVIEPATVTPLLQQTANRRIVSDDDVVAKTERFLDKATAKVLIGDDLGETRDQIRRFKNELGSALLHPRTLRAAVAYNVAMWNQIAEEIDGSRSIEELAGNLIESEPQEDPSISHLSNGNLLGLDAFTRIVSAYGSSVSGNSVEDESMMRVIRIIAQRPLRREERDLFSAENTDEISRLTRAAVVLGLILLDRAALAEPLTQLGLKVDELATQYVGELMNRMSALARESFAASNYGDAFRLSDVKTHYLASHAVLVKTGGGVDPLPSRSILESRITTDKPGILTRLAHQNLRVPSGLWAVVLVILGMAAIPRLISEDSPTLLRDRQELASVSPFLEHGRQFEKNNKTYFVGDLSRTWDFVATDERKGEAMAIGSHFDGLGVHHVTLVDANRSIVALYENGKLKILLPYLSRKLADIEPSQ